MTNIKYYKIGEVCRILNIQPHVLRYWEKEFPQLSPKRISNQRIYTQEDLELIKTIKALLSEQKLTIEGAKKILKTKKKTTVQRSFDGFNHTTEDLPNQPDKEILINRSLLMDIKRSLVKIKEILENDKTR